MIRSDQSKGMLPEIVGLIPAGGQGKRVAPLPCSKELFPIGFHGKHKELGLRPKVVSHYLLEKMRLANITKAFIILRKGKWDIPAYFGDGKFLNMDLAYLTIDVSFGVPYTLDRAYSFVRNRMVALGFPDVLLQPQDSFVRLLKKQEETNSDVVLGLYPTDQPQKMDVIDLKKDGSIKEIKVKPSKLSKATLRYAWQTTIWKPVFTEYLHGFVAEHKKRFSANSSIKFSEDNRELFLGEVFQKAIEDNVSVSAVEFADGNCFDIGTPEDLAKALHSNFLC
jgi:glucose-1-phosphate thymidylyltransferase